MRPAYSVLAYFAAGLATITAAPATAASIVGGSTSVTLTAAPTLTSLGIAVAPTGTATAMTNSSGQPVVTFPITGGSTNQMTGAATIFHDGSGLLFTSGTNSLGVGNFVIDTMSLLISGYATANGSTTADVPLFSIGAGNTLLLTQQASSAFGTVFDVNIPAGTQVGVARVNPITAAVPEPATWLMMLLGFGAIGLTVRYRRARPTSLVRA